ncbi:aminopeptidase N [Thalassotalea ganghwensis]
MSEDNARYLKDYQPSDFLIETIDLTFELDDRKTLVTSILKIKKQRLTAKQLILNGEHLTLLKLQLNNEVLDSSQYHQTPDSLTLDVDSEEATLKIITEIDPLNNTALEGLFKSGDAFCTQCEAEGFRRITYYLDRPDVMAKFTTKVIADKSLYPYLLSNGNKVDSGEIDDNKHFVTWYDPFPKPCYLFALVAGDFDLLADKYETASGRIVDLEIFVDKGNKDKAHHAMASLKNSMAWDEQTFGLEYDLDIYMIVAVDFFNMGAMENKGLNIFNSKYVLADKNTATDTDYFNVEAVIAHEYFHNWTGNRVTCRDWFQLSLKEGLTVFRDQQFSADMHSAPVTRIANVNVLRSHQFAEDAGPMSHPIRPEKVVEMNNFYTLTVYEKGSEVIRMMYTLLGKDKFRKGMDLYFKRFDGQAVTCDDFVNAMADASGIDLTLFKRWYSQSGTPTLVINECFDEKTSVYSISISQQHLPSKNQTEKQPLHIPVAIELISNGSSQSHLLELKQDQQTWEFGPLLDKPVLAVLANFSAPVKINYSQTEQALTEIILHAKDDFLKWDAGQKLFTNILQQLLSNSEFVLEGSLLEVLEQVLASNADFAFIAEQLTLPSYHGLIELFKPVDPIALLDARQTLKLFIANGLKDTFSQRYKSLIREQYANDGKSVGERALKNVLLSYLTQLPDYKSLVSEQFGQATNMTDSLAALTSAAAVAHQDFDNLMASFEQQWRDTTLVMDKWFSLQASYQSENIFERLDTFTSHELFSLKNPNRARSLIGAFTQNNPRYFHCKSGRGYQFLTDQVCALDAINPQVASRLITPLIQFDGVDLERQSMMKVQLQRIAQRENLSKDLSEKIDAALS